MRLKLLLIAVGLGLIWGTCSTKILAVGNLEGMSDILSNTTAGASNVEHQVTFRLPLNAQGIISSDYIIVDLGNFSNVTAPTSITGIYAGTPTFSVSGNEAKITGIIVQPGITLTIDGIQATNPGLASQYLISIIVAEDSDGNIIKNVGNVIASSTAGSVTVTATVDPPVASLVITGYTSPGTFVTFTQNGTVIGTDSAGPTGYFSQVFTGLQPTTHNLRIYGVDQSSRATAPLFLEIYTPIYQQTTISDIILPPTIELNSTSILQGDDLVVSGAGVPNGDISLFTESPLRSYSTTIDNAGDWDYTITDTADYSPGDYRTYGIVQSGSLQSISSIALGFTILGSGLTPTPAGCNISRADLNCDNIISLPDLSILMYYWGSTQPAGDVNSDGMVSLVDLSIMMYYWGT